MKVKNATWVDVLSAIETINKKIYEGNIKVNPNHNGVKQFTLRPLDSHRKGGKRNPLTGRYIHACCWHVHGDFFDALFEIAPKAVITALGRKITKDEGNWVDYKTGYMSYASEWCDC